MRDVIDLRDYQQKSIDMLRQALREGSRAPILVLPTGAGKTVVSAAICQMGMDKGNRTHFTAPRRNLVSQTADSFARLGLDCGVIMAGDEFDSRHMIDISSIDTLCSRIDKPHSIGAESLRLCKVYIYDEAHCHASPVRAKIINDLREGVYGPGKIVIGLTATPAGSGGGGLGDICDRLIQPVTMRELIDAGHLLQPEYWAAPSPDLAGVKITNGDYNAKQLGEVYDDGLMGCVVDNWWRIAIDTSTVVFTATRANAASVIGQFAERGVPAAYLDCKTPDEERQRIFDAVRARDILVIANVGIVGMGTDIPVLQTACLAVATKSVSRWMQWVGRVLRPCDGQTHATIIDHGNNVRRLGRCEDITDWSLDAVSNANDNASKKADKTARKEIKCRECSYIFSGSSVCPQCGHKIPEGKQRKEDIEFTPANLQRVGAVAKKSQYTQEQKSSYYAQLLGYALQHGKKPGSAYFLYIEIFGVGLAGKKPDPVPPGPEVLGMIRHLQIKKAHSKGAA
jgi:superfamily II DNA or RNA helicase